MDSNEDDEYLSDPKNLMLLVVGMVWQRLNRDIFKYIDMPVGTKLIRCVRSLGKFHLLL